MKKLFLSLAIILSLNASSQVEDGSIATDFTLTDWYGETHHLYSYLDADKTVFLEIFAAHCPSCWSYHQTDRLKNLYNTYGPDATNEIMVLALEHDQYNGELAFTGIGDPWNTAGNWLEGTPYPQFNVEGDDRSVFTDYNVTFYPVIYKICPDRTIERMNTSASEEQLYQKVQECQIASIDEEEKIWNVRFDPLSRTVIVEHSEELKSLNIINLQGQIIQTIPSISNSTINVSGLTNGIYLFQFETNATSIIEKLVIFE
jgi:hypothetical protein